MKVGDKVADKVQDQGGKATPLKCPISTKGGLLVKA
jgi:hypothetical protein